MIYPAIENEEWGWNSLSIIDRPVEPDASRGACPARRRLAGVTLATGGYDIDRSERRRASAKRRGEANLQYIRCGQFFLLMPTKGDHPFKDAERDQIRDVRRVPIKFAGYSISYRRGGRTRQGEPDPKWHAHVEIERAQYLLLRDYFLERAVHRRAETLARAFFRIEFEPYAPIRRQLLAILRQVNRKRAGHGYEPISTEALRLRRKVVKPFELPAAEQVAA